MRLSRAGEYAVRCVLHMASRPMGQVVPRWAVAQAMDIPPPFLAKIGQQLARVGVLEIVQGAKGGFRLRRPPDQVTLLEVVEAVMGELFLNDCIMRPASCSRSQDCTVHLVWQKARAQLRQTLAEATFQSLLEGQSCFVPGPAHETTSSPPRSGTREQES